MKPREVMEGMFQQGPRMLRTSRPGGAQQFAGRTTLSSGSASVTVSTAVVNSDTMFFLGSVVTSAGGAANSGGGLAVNSVVSGVSFALARPTGTAVPFDETVSWELVLTSQVR